MYKKKKIPYVGTAVATISIGSVCFVAVAVAARRHFAVRRHVCVGEPRAWCCNIVGVPPVYAHFQAVVGRGNVVFRHG